jgi:hypothetical protein
VAALFAATGHGALGPQYAYAHSDVFNDVADESSNGSCDGGALCSARPGYDGPTGWGTPNGGLLSAAGTSGKTLHP